MAQFYWSKDLDNGFVYPTITTDDVVVGGAASPQGRWFDDGDLVLGGNAMSGTEVLYTIGSQRLEAGGCLMTERASVSAPAAGDGVFWVESTSPSLPKFTDDGPNTYTLLYAADGLSLQGIDQTLIVDKTGGAYAADGTQQLPYNSIASAIAAATALTPTSTNRILILIYPGVYDEALTTADSYVYFAGFDRETTIIRQSSGTSPPLTLIDGHTGFKNLSFECDTTHTGRIVSATNAIGNDTPVIFDTCAFLGNGATSTNNYVLFTTVGAEVTFLNCSFLQDDDTELIFHETGGGSSEMTFSGCDFLGRFNNDNASSGSTVRGFNCKFVSAVPENWRGTVRTRFLTPKFYWTGCHFENTSSTGIAVYSDLDSTVFTNCTFIGGSSTGYDVRWDSGSKISAFNCWFTRGLSSVVIPANGHLYAGTGPQRVPFHQSLNECISSGNSNAGVTPLLVTLLEDQTLASQLTSVGSGREMTIDGGCIYTIDRAGSRVIQLSNVNVPVRFKDVQVKGEVYVTGAGATAYFQNARLEGRAFIQGTALVRGVGSTFTGDATYTSPLEINSATCEAYYSNCYLKGHTGNPAVHYGTDGTVTTFDMDAVYMERTVCMHGSLSTNNPFGGAGVGGTPPVNDYYAHDCTFNQEPALADPTYLENQIDSGQRHNTIDPDGDYTWLAAW
jgi:pectin methylesterase-like acyl-CoA thioesterase